MRLLLETWDFGNCQWVSLTDGSYYSTNLTRDKKKFVFLTSATIELGHPPNLLVYLKLAAFLRNLTFPVICANFQTNDTAINALDIKPYIILEQHSLGIIGVITPDTEGIRFTSNFYCKKDPDTRIPNL